MNNNTPTQPETSDFYDPELDGEYTPNGGSK